MRHNDLQAQKVRALNELREFFAEVEKKSNEDDEFEREGIPDYRDYPNRRNAGASAVRKTFEKSGRGNCYSFLSLVIIRACCSLIEGR